jgi:hypothetical protein
MSGMIRKSPGPFRARNFPSLKTTALLHWSATRVADEVIAATHIAMPKTKNATYSCPVACKLKPRTAPIPAIIMNMKAGTEPFVFI